ncbi:MAG: hypothetical protein RLZZ343_1621, partial [Actinomycetota bacterium]
VTGIHFNVLTSPRQMSDLVRGRRELRVLVTDLKKK